MKSQNAIWKLMARVLSGEANEQEKKELYQYLLDKPDLQKQFDTLRLFWQHEPNHESSKEQDDAKIEELFLATHDTALEQAEKTISLKNYRRKKIWVAAACIGGLAIIFLTTIIKEPSQLQSAARRIIAPNGSRLKTQLPDGSVIYLNAGSALSQINFSDSQRSVALSGEGYFDITHDSLRPFILHTGGININVLGTRFTVRSYPDEATIEATLLQGAVALTTENGQEFFRLKPNQKMSMKKNGRLQTNEQSSNSEILPVYEKDFLISVIDTTLSKKELPETSWVYNRLTFKGENFEQLAKKMERWFNVEIIISDERIKKFQFTGSFENETIEQALIALQAAESFSYKINQHQIFINTP